MKARFFGACAFQPSLLESPATRRRRRRREQRVEESQVVRLDRRRVMPTTPNGAANGVGRTPARTRTRPAGTSPSARWRRRASPAPPRARRGAACERLVARRGSFCGGAWATRPRRASPTTRSLDRRNLVSCARGGTSREVAVAVRDDAVPSAHEHVLEWLQRRACASVRARAMRTSADNSVRQSARRRTEPRTLETDVLVAAKVQVCRSSRVARARARATWSSPKGDSAGRDGSRRRPKRVAGRGQRGDEPDIVDAAREVALGRTAGQSLAERVDLGVEATGVETPSRTRTPTGIDTRTVLTTRHSLAVSSRSPFRARDTCGRSRARPRQERFPGLERVVKTHVRVAVHRGSRRLARRHVPVGLLPQPRDVR